MMVMQQTATDPAVEDELDRLATMPIARLRARYREWCSRRPTQGVRSGSASAQHCVSDSGEGLWRPPAFDAAPTRSDDEGFCDETRWEDRAARAGSNRLGPGAGMEGQEPPRHGAAEGFAYDGKTYTNLSEIAVLITGTRWNGPRFFGLRTKLQEGSESVPPERSGSAKRTTQAKSSSRLGGGSDYRKRNAILTAKAASNGSRHGR